MSRFIQQHLGKDRLGEIGAVREGNHIGQASSHDVRFGKSPQTLPLRIEQDDVPVSIHDAQSVTHGTKHGVEFVPLLGQLTF